MTEKRPILKLNFNVNKEQLLNKLAPLVQSQAKKEVKNTVESKPVAQPKPPVQAKPKIEAQPQPKPQPQAQVKTEAAVKLEPKPQGEPKPAAKPKPKRKFKHKFKPRPQIPKKVYIGGLDNTVYRKIQRCLQAKYPNCFTIPAIPLKIGISEDLLGKLDELDTTAEELTTFIKWYCRSAKYRALVEESGMDRTDLDGNKFPSEHGVPKESQNTTLLNNDVAKK